MQIHKIVVPTPFYVGPVNVYLVRNDPLTLIDVGPNTEEAYQTLKEGLTLLGINLEQIKRIIISHAHEDHYGLAWRVQEVSGAEILMHSWEEKKVINNQDYTEHKKLLNRAGVPKEIIERFEQGYLRFSPLAGNKINFNAVEDEEDIVFENGSLKVLHTPGHTPGSICLLRESNRELIAADTVIKHISPNPMLHVDPLDCHRRFPSLSEYLCSVSRIKEIAPTFIHSGHGHPILDYGEHFHRLLTRTQERQMKVISLLPKRGGTAWEISGLLFPNADGMHRYLAVSEAQAHLDMAVADERLIIEQQDETEYFLLKGS
ncbi:MAG: Zn-dependent hydrolase [bacterium]|nr:MAG: Zn-dependent hydrolase [bacterium]